MVQASLPQNKAALEMTLCSLISLSVSRQPEQVHQILAYRGFQVSVCLFFFFATSGHFFVYSCCLICLHKENANGKDMKGTHI